MNTQHKKFRSRNHRRCSAVAFESLLEKTRVGEPIALKSPFIPSDKPARFLLLFGTFSFKKKKYPGIPSRQRKNFMKSIDL